MNSPDFPLHPAKRAKATQPILLPSTAGTSRMASMACASSANSPTAMSMLKASMCFFRGNGRTMGFSWLIVCSISEWFSFPRGCFWAG